MSQEIINLGRPSVLRRFAAMFYDFWLLAALWLAVTAVMVVLRMTFDGEGITQGDRVITGIWKAPTFLLMLVAMYGFFTHFWVKNGQTLAMQTWRIRLVNNDMQPITYAQAYKRLSFAMLSLACFGLGYFWALIDKDGLSWHDKLSNTQLILTPKRK